jgi:hypothetical protein
LVLSIFQRYKMKANHNNQLIDQKKYLGAFNISKIQDESKSPCRSLCRASSGHFQ